MHFGRGRERSATTNRQRRRAQSWLFGLAFFALAVGSVAGVALARQRAVDTAQQRIDQAAARTAAAIETEFQRLSAGVAGSAALVDRDGALDVEAFGVFAADVIAAGGMPSLALIEVDVSAGSSPYRLLAAEPGGVPAADDLIDDRIDAAHIEAFGAAIERDGLSLSGVVPLVPSGEPGVELVRPVIDRRAPGRPVVGLVVVGVPVRDLSRILRDAAGPGPDIAVLHGEELIVGPEFDPRVETVAVAATVVGRDWTVVLGPPPEPDLTGGWLVAAGGISAIVAMGALAMTTNRQQRRLGRANSLLRVSEERTRAVQEVAGRLARALTAGEIVTALVDHLPAAVGAASAAIVARDDSGTLVILGPDEDDDVPGVPLPDAADCSHVTTVLESRQPAWLRSPLDWRHDEATAALADGGSALALLPLVAEDVTGVLAVSYPKVRIFADEEMDLLHTVGLLAARALARGKRYDAEHRTAVAFQRAALPDDLPAVDGLSIAARYRPATRQATVGGDWYDVLVLDERRVVLVVGDVVGHGMVAAAAMGRLRTAFQAIARLSTDPGAMLTALGHQVDSIPDSFCTTVVCVVIDLEDQTMAWSRAGHPPPLVLTAEGAELLDDHCLPPLGVAADVSAPVHVRPLSPGDRVVLYTDGAVERREESIDDGFRRLGVIGENLSDLEPDEFTDALVEALVPGDQMDDVAILVVDFDGSPLVLPPDDAQQTQEIPVRTGAAPRQI